MVMTVVRIVMALIDADDGDDDCDNAAVTDETVSIHLSIDLSKYRLFYPLCSICFVLCRVVWCRFVSLVSFSFDRFVSFV